MMSCSNSADFLLDIDNIFFYFGVVARFYAAPRHEVYFSVEPPLQIIGKVDKLYAYRL